MSKRLRKVKPDKSWVLSFLIYLPLDSSFCHKSKSMIFAYIQPEANHESFFLCVVFLKVSNFLVFFNVLKYFTLFLYYVLHC